MKKVLSGLVICSCLLLIANCGDKNHDLQQAIRERMKDRRPMTFEVISGDTVNRMDSWARKQGHWKVFQNPWAERANLIEEGNYVDNRKDGAWKYYDSSGRLIRIVQFTDDVAR